MSSRPDHDALLLLSRDLRFDGRDLRFGGRDLRLDDAATADEAPATQLTLPGLTSPPARAPRRRRGRAGDRHTDQPTAPTSDPLLAAFQRRLAVQGRAPKGQRAYLYQLRSMLVIAARISGRPLTCADLLRDEALLGHVLVDDSAPTLGRQLSKWTLAQRRSAIRDFVTLMRPELLRLLDDDPHVRLDRALRGVAERVGAGYRLTGGAPRRRGGSVPIGSQIRDVLDAVGTAPGYLGLRNRAFFQILAETGARINALRGLDGADCIEMPDGRLRLFLHEKGKGEPREVELSRGVAAALHAYTQAFNYHAAIRRWALRVHLGETGAVWRNSPRGCWAYDDILATLRAGCLAAEIVPFTPHAFRRAFATDATSRLPRHTVALAGGWQGLERLDDHYVQPRTAAIREKLARQQQPDTVVPLERSSYAPVHPV